MVECMPLTRPLSRQLSRPRFIAGRSPSTKITALPWAGRKKRCGYAAEKFSAKPWEIL